MIVTLTDIQNAIYKAQNMVYAIALNITECYEQGSQPSDEKYELATQLQSYIEVLGRVDLDENDCIDSDEIWNIISWINGNQVLAEMCLTIPAQYSNPGQPIPAPDSGCCGVETVTGPQVDNTDPKHPVVGVYGDGVTITGTGTALDPFVAVGGGGGSGTVNVGTQYRLAYYAANGNAVSQANAITGSRALKSDASGVPTHFDTATEPSLTELTYVKGVTSAIQTQLNSKQGIAVEVTGNLTAANDTYYINTANATYTDPTPAQAKGYIVLVRNGTATIGGTGYSVAGSLIYRYYHSGAWASYLIGGFVTAGTQYQLAYYSATGNAVVGLAAITGSRALVSDANGLPVASTVTSTQLFYLTKRLAKTALSAAHTGTVANTYVDSLLIPANTFGAGDIIEVLSRVNKTTSTNVYTHRLYVNTAASLAGSPILIATAATAGAANRFQQITRQMEIMVANGSGAGTEVMIATTASTQDDVQQTDMTTCAIDWTVNQYIVCAIQLTSALDSINNHFIMTR